MRIVIKYIMFISVSLLLPACPAEQRVETPAERVVQERPEQRTPPIPEPMRSFDDDGNVYSVAIGSDDSMRFDVEEFNVEAGQMVRLVLSHTGRLPVQTMGHNVVILQQGEDVLRFASEVMQEGGNEANSYVPEQLRGRVIAFTEIIGGGQTTTVEFQAPDEPGEYPYLCSFPGHAALMRGLMNVN